MAQPEWGHGPLRNELGYNCQKDVGDWRHHWLARPEQYSWLRCSLFILSYLQKKENDKRFRNSTKIRMEVLISFFFGKFKKIFSKVDKSSCLSAAETSCKQHLSTVNAKTKPKAHECDGEDCVSTDSKPEIQYIALLGETVGAVLARRVLLSFSSAKDKKTGNHRKSTHEHLVSTTQHPVVCSHANSPKRRPGVNLSCKTSAASARAPPAAQATPTHSQSGG